MFEGLDFVLAEARRRGILVILTLVNYWGDYGGMPQVRPTVLPALQHALVQTTSVQGFEMHRFY